MYIYIHLPFFTSICSFCDFPKLLYDKKYTYRYLDTLKEEILSRYSGEEIKSIYIGGGTPTSLDLEELKYLFSFISSIFNYSSDIEFTIESNVESLSKDKIKLLKSYGVNRVSLGVQSLNNNTLKELNRKHTKSDVFRVIKELKEEGFKNISMDYIYGVHNNTEEVKDDISTFLELDIPHISCYSLIIEDNTIFGINNRKYIDEDIEEAMYKYIKNTLEDNDYKHYEISNYAKDGYESKHNLNYWNNNEYYGFGLGAVSYLNNNRITNTKNLTKYLDKNYIDSTSYEDINIDISNTFMLGLRKVLGIDIIEFKNKYNKDIIDIEPVKRLINEGKLVLNNNRLFIHPNYFYLSNEIIIEFI